MSGLINQAPTKPQLIEKLRMEQGVSRENAMRVALCPMRQFFYCRYPELTVCHHIYDETYKVMQRVRTGQSGDNTDPVFLLLVVKATGIAGCRSIIKMQPDTAPANPPFDHRRISSYQ